jgi:hypothetical protein
MDWRFIGLGDLGLMPGGDLGGFPGNFQNNMGWASCEPCYAPVFWPVIEPQSFEIIAAFPMLDKF